MQRSTTCYDYDPLTSNNTAIANPFPFWGHFLGGLRSEGQQAMLKAVQESVFAQIREMIPTIANKFGQSI